MILRRSGGKGWENESINDKDVYRTALATPGLLTTTVKETENAIFTTALGTSVWQIFGY